MRCTLRAGHAIVFCALLPVLGDTLARAGAPDERTNADLINAFRSENAETMQKAQDELGRRGRLDKKVVKALVRALGDKHESVRLYAAGALVRVGRAAVPALAETLTSESARVRQLAADALDSIGPQAAGAIPALLKATKDVNRVVRGAVVSALGGIGDEKAIPRVVQILKEDPEECVRHAALGSLANFGPKAASAVPAILEVMKAESVKDLSDGFSLATPACLALACIGAEAVAPLCALLKDEKTDRRVRGSAAWTFVRMAQGGAPEPAKAAAPTLVEVLMDNDRDLRDTAADALESLGPRVKLIIPLLKKMIKEGAGDRPVLAARTLCRVDPSDKAGLEALMKALDQPETSIRIAAIVALANLGSEAKEAVPALEKLLKDDNKKIRPAAATALERITGEKRK